MKDLIDEELLNHIISQHLPLQCNKCSKMFEEKYNFHETDICHRTSTITTTIINTNASSVKFENKENEPILMASSQQLASIPEISAKSQVTNCELNTYKKCGNNLENINQNDSKNNSSDSVVNSPSPPVGIVNQRTKQFEKG